MSTDYLSEVFGVGGLFASKFPGYEMREGQVALAGLVEEAIRTNKHALGEGPCGCHVAGQEILLADGRIKVVEDIVVGDELMGPGGAPRQVLALARGVQETVEIRPFGAAPWRVNLDHILTLLHMASGEVVDVRVREWIEWPKEKQDQHWLFRSAVEFHGPKAPLPVSPYSLGSFLGAGGAAQGTPYAGSSEGEKPEPAAPETPASDAGEEEAARAMTAILQGLQGLGILLTPCEERFIPSPYTTASAHDRMELLAGLLDSGGAVFSPGCYGLHCRSRELARGAVFVARSLGFEADMDGCERWRPGKCPGQPFRALISGKVDEIPCRAPRGSGPGRIDSKTLCRYPFDAFPTGKLEPYFGFSLDGDGRYLLGDFMVTHNTGKSVAYSVPATWHAAHHQKKVVIATANIALQEQLIKKDLPMLAKVLPWRFSFALLKGRNNFLCHSRLLEIQERGDFRCLTDPEHRIQSLTILDWAKTTFTGDVSELPFVPAGAVWSRCASSSDDCMGDECEHAGGCFFEHAKSRAWQASVIVTNFHVLFAHLAVRRKTTQHSVLPPADLMILDEGHDAADVAREFFGFTVSEISCTRLAGAADDFGLRGTANTLREEAHRLFAALGRYAESPLYNQRLKDPDFVEAPALIEALRALERYAEGRAERVELPDKERSLARRVGRQAERIRSRIASSLKQSDPNHVYWLELDGKDRVKLRAKPVRVDDLLREELFQRCPTVCVVSATLTTTDTFDFIRGQLGVPDGALELVAESPFNLTEQTLLVLPEGLPEPREPDFVLAAAEAFNQVVQACGGRTLGLFTSYRNLEAVRQRLDCPGHRVLCQGELPRSELTRIFKEDVSSVLLGTDSFWTGIDVPGEALTAVVIDKLPFPSPEDPVIAAHAETDPRAFHNYLIPLAIIKLRQGVGRLIRAKTDVGVIVILDRRLMAKGYGKKILRSLPPMLHTRKLEHIGCFLKEAADARAR